MADLRNTVPTRRPAPRVAGAADGGPARWKVILGWGGAALGVLFLFFMVWKSQFAAPAGLLFGTQSEGEQAGYCMAVAQDINPSGAPAGSVMEEAAKFWLSRLRESDGRNLGPAIAAGRKRLAENIAISNGSSEDWLLHAMSVCMNRAVMFGMRRHAG